MWAGAVPEGGHGGIGFLQQFWLHLGLVHRWGVSSGFSSSKALDGIELGLSFPPFPLCLPVRAGFHAIFHATILFASKNIH